MSKAVFVLGSLEVSAVKQGAPFTQRTLQLLEELQDAAGLDDVEIVLATQDEYMAGKNKKDIGIAHIRDERPRVIQEISQAAPDFVLCFGPVAAASVFDHGSLTEKSLIRQTHFPLSPELPVYYTYGMENIWRAPGLRQWLFLDIQTIVAGQMGKVEYGDYVIIQPGAELWGCGPFDGDNYPTGRCPLDTSTIALDTETYPGLAFYHPQARLRMIQFSHQAGIAWVVQLTPESGMPDWLRDIIEDPTVRKVGSNIAYDYKWLRRFGVRMENFEDTAIREHIIDQSNPKKDLKSLTLKYLPRLGDYEREFYKLLKQRAKEHGVKEKDAWKYIKDHEMYTYAAGDAEASIAAWQGQEKALFNLGRPRSIFKDLNETLAGIEFNGICVDVEKNTELDCSYANHLASLRSEITPVLGTINLNSPMQLARALKEAVPDINLRVKKLARLLGTDEDEEISTARDILERESGKHPIITKVLEHRRYRVRHSTFIKGVMEKYLVEHHGHKFIHPSYRLDGPDTYRSASREPNMHNIPRVDEDNPHLSVKQQFVSRFPGGHILDIDQGQLEIRVAAFLSQDKRMLEVINSGGDFHTTMAQEFFGTKHVTAAQRSASKELTFGVSYGGGAGLLAGKLDIPTWEAKGLIDSYFRRFSGLKAYIDSVHEEARRTLQVDSMFGFIRHFLEPEKGWKSADGREILRQAFNFKEQGPAFHLLGCALIELQAELERRDMLSKLVLQVHDSAVLDVHPDELEEAIHLSKYCMEVKSLERARRYGVEFTVPLQADAKVGPNWGEVA